MTTRILDRIREVQAGSDIKILFACESGSRGWGFPSMDSDYDVRFIYIRQQRHYFSVRNPDLDLHFPIEDELDVYGWDLRKVLQLINKSNTTPFEWLQSPIVYVETPGFKEELLLLCQDYFQPRSCIHHYLGITRKTITMLTAGERLTIKQLFYGLRSILSASWYRQFAAIAPMAFEPLTALLPESLQEEVSFLIRRKADTAEGDFFYYSQALLSFIRDEYLRIEEAVPRLNAANDDIRALDDFFIKTIDRYDN